MKFQKLILFLFITTFHFYSKAQDQQATTMQFPHLGTYNVQAGSGSTDFNQVVIGSHTFSLQMNGVPVRSYQITSEFKGGFRVEQFLQNGEVATGQLDAFNVRIFSATENEYMVEINYPQGSQKIHLIK